MSKKKASKRLKRKGKKSYQTELGFLTLKQLIIDIERHIYKINNHDISLAEYLNLRYENAKWELTIKMPDGAMICESTQVNISKKGE